MKKRFVLFFLLLVALVLFSSCEQKQEIETTIKEEETTILQQKEVAFSYSLLENGTYEVALVSAYDKTEIEIPAEYNGKEVTKIADYGFSDATNITKITIPEGITKIGKYAFSSCTSLMEITMPNSLCVISPYAFKSCYALKNITLPVQIKTIENGLFYDCHSLENVQILGEITIVGNVAFANCVSLKNLTLPNTILEIGSFAFYNCEELSTFTLPSNIETLSDYAFYNCLKLEAVIVPQTIEKIGMGVFPNDTLVCYLGSRDEWNSIEKLQDYTYARYTESEPTSTTLKWHYNEEGIPEHWHYYTYTSLNPTCTEAGYKESTCIHCGYQSYRKLNALGGSHNYVDGICTKCGKSAIKLIPNATSTWLQFSNLEVNGTFILDYDLVFSSQTEQQNTCVWLTIGSVAYFSRMQRRTDTTFTVTSQIYRNNIWSDNQNGTIENSLSTMHIRFERENSQLKLSIFADGTLAYTYTLTSAFMDGNYDLSGNLTSIMFQSEGGNSFSIENVVLTNGNSKQTEFTFYENEHWTIENQ